MLAFITSLRHPLNSADYGRVEQLLADTLASVTAQTSDDFHVFVVGNKRPDFDLGPRVTFVPVDFPPPVNTPGPRTARAPFVWDKGTKIGVGLIAARAVAPDHVMIFDADDFVSRDLAEFASARRGEPGWVVEEGYIFSRARQAYRVQERFNQTCGTCHIVAWDAYAVPAALTVEATQDEVAAGFGERLNEVLGAHHGARAWFAAQGFPLAALPFRGAVYHVDTGENHSGKALTGLVFPLGRRFAAEFGVPRLTSYPVAAWRAFYPTARNGIRNALARVTRRRAAPLAD